ncbi:hypothetical protein [Lysinibacillus xylanilyticus]|uniref:Uncharacterized protein n=1 Tax=Lysinibacillus xylanilyticus TaxID=582475 RepID=A0ABT4EMP0_9BACI|nr:hypothetical protein [Lysinibacillus xylanilyticus]MCY9546788.1 hypothetical protein [Lysinibacillus xylanilyticus]
MINTGNITNIIEKMKELHINDPAIENYWNQLVLEFNAEKDTIHFLDTCTEEEASWISSIFDDLAHVFQSKEYADCLKRLDKKYPNLLIAHDIELAESYLS